jgi:hypothetical protein
MAEEIAAVDLRVVEDTGTDEWSQQFQASLAEFPWTPRLRVLVARA